METQAQFCVYCCKINTKLFSGEPKLPLIPRVRTSPNISKIFL